MPDMQHRILYRPSIRAGNLAGHGQRFGIIGITGEVDIVSFCQVAINQRRTCHIEWALDGARRSAAYSGFGILGIHVQINKVLNADARRDQAEFARTFLQENQRLPEFAFAYVMFFNRYHNRLEQIACNCLETCIAARFGNAAGAIEQ